MLWQQRLNRILARTGFEVRRARRRRPGRRRRTEQTPAEAHGRLLVAPVFILASIRSGSTLLRVLLNSHSALHAPHELQLGHVRVELASEYATHAMHELGYDETTLEYLLWDRILHRELQRSGKKHIVNKTPRDVFIWRRIAECWPDARFIFLLRHPVAIARSRQQARWQASREGDIGKVLRFMNSLERARRNLDGFTVRYEELTAEPERVTQELCAFLEVPWEPGMLDYGRVDHGKHGPGLGDWGRRMKSGRIQPARAVPLEEEVPEELRALCKAWGYAERSGVAR